MRCHQKRRKHKEIVHESHVLFFVFSFRNTPHRQVQRGLTEHGRCPQQASCFKFTSTSCVAKCASSSGARRLVSKMSADQLMPLLQGKLICVSKRQEEGHDIADLHAGCSEQVWKERRMPPSSGEDERKGLSQLSFGRTGDECTLECRCKTLTWQRTKRSLREALLQ